MGETLEELREELANIYRRISDEENELTGLYEEAAGVIGNIEGVKSEIKELYETAGQLEDKIYRLSS